MESELVISRDPRHQVWVLTGRVDLEHLPYDQRKAPWPWMVRGCTTKACRLNEKGHPVLTEEPIFLLVQGEASVERAMHVLSHGSYVVMKGSGVRLEEPTGGVFSGLGYLVGSIYPLAESKP